MSKVTTRDVLALGGLLERLDALTEDTPSPVYLIPEPVPIHHEDGWLIGVAVYEDDQWWVDFTNYGTDDAVLSARIDAGNVATRSDVYVGDEKA